MFPQEAAGPDSHVIAGCLGHWLWTLYLPNFMGRQKTAMKIRSQSQNSELDSPFTAFLLTSHCLMVTYSLPHPRPPPAFHHLSKQKDPARPSPATQEYSENESNNIGIGRTALWNMCLCKSKKAFCAIIYSRSNMYPLLWCCPCDKSALCPLCYKAFPLWLVRIQNILSPMGPLEIVQPSTLQWFDFLCLIFSSNACTVLISRRLKGTPLQISRVFSLPLSLLRYSAPWFTVALSSLNFNLCLLNSATPPGRAWCPFPLHRCLETPHTWGKLEGSPHLFLFPLW